MQRHFEVGIFVAPDDLQELVAGQHKLRDRGHQMVERLDVDTDRVGGEPIVPLFVRPLVCRPVARRGLRFILLRCRRTRLRRARIGPGDRRLFGSFVGVPVELFDKIAVFAGRFAFVRFDLVENVLDAVDAGENERDGVGGDRHAVAEFAHQAFGGMRERFQARQAKKPASALDGMNQPKNVAEDVPVVRFLLEPNEFGIDPLQAFARLSQEFPEQVVHATRLTTTPRDDRRSCPRPPPCTQSACRRRQARAPGRPETVCCQSV